MEKFWSAISKDVGPIPDGIKAILEYAGFINGALGELNDKEMAAIENDIRRIPFEAADETIEICYRKFQNNPENFRFVSGERALLLMLAAAVKKKGINHYLKPQKTVSTPADPSSITNEKDILKRKIIEYFEKKCDEYNGLEEHIRALQSLDIEIHSTDRGVHANIKCVYCFPEKYVLCRAERVGRWKITNFISHLSNAHAISVQRKLPVSTSEKRKISDIDLTKQSKKSKHLIDFSNDKENVSPDEQTSSGNDLWLKPLELSRSEAEPSSAVGGQSFLEADSSLTEPEAEISLEEDTTKSSADEINSLLEESEMPNFQEELEKFLTLKDDTIEYIIEDEVDVGTPSVYNQMVDPAVLEGQRSDIQEQGNNDVQQNLLHDPLLNTSDQDLNERLNVQGAA